MSKTSNVELGNKELIDFFIKDFEEISAKLESTDKKVQFFTQLYITLITAIVAAFGKDFLQIDSNDKYLFLSIILFAFHLIGQFVLLYMLSGQRIHSDYVCKLNSIRFLILKTLNKSYDFIQQYGYTACKAPSSKGMNYWMVYLMVGTNLIFLGTACYAFDSYFAYKFGGTICVYAILILIFSLLMNIYNLWEHHKEMQEKAEDNDKKKLECARLLNETRKPVLKQ